MYRLKINIIGIITCCLAIYSQAGNYFASQGSLWLGGIAGYSSYGESGSDNRTNVLNFSPIVRVFPVKFFFVGPLLDGTYSSSKNFHSSNLGLGAELGGAFNIHENNNIIPYVRTGFQYCTNYFENEESLNSRKYRLNGFSVPVFGGIIFKLFDCIGMQIEPGMIFENWEGNRSNTFKCMIGFCGLRKHAVSILGKL